MKEKDLGKEKIQIGKRIIAFVGPEGAGKTTMAKLLTDDSGRPYLTTGDTLRDLAANDPGHLGDACRKMFEEHAYLAGDLLLQIMSDRFSQEDTVNGFVLDGGFRTLEETRDFPMALEGAGRDLPVTVFYLNIPTEMCFERLVTGEDARKRSDDTVEALTLRLEKFYKQLDERLELIKNYHDWELIEIDATAPIEEVYTQVCRVISRQSL